MVRKRIRIDIEDAEGANFNLNLSGNITREPDIEFEDDD